MTDAGWSEEEWVNGNDLHLEIRVQVSLSLPLDRGTHDCLKLRQLLSQSFLCQRVAALALGSALCFYASSALPASSVF